MQEQRSTVEPFLEAFDHASSSSNSAIDPQVCWTNTLNTGDVRNLPECLLSPGEENMSLGRVVSHETGTLSDWNFRGSSSNEPMINLTNHDEAEVENQWTAPLTADVRASPIFEERRQEAANMLSLNNVGINLNSNPVVPGQFFLQNSGSSDTSQNSDRNARLIGRDGQLSQPGTCPHYNPFGAEVDQSPASGSTNSCGTSTGGFSYLSEDADGRPGSSLEGRRLSGKRKNIEGVPGQSSGSGSHSGYQHIENSLLHNVPARNITSSSLNISRSSDNLSSVNPPEEHLNARYNAGSRAAASECLSSVSAAGIVEDSQRNFRMRMNPAHQADSSASNLWALGNSSRRSSVWSPHPSSLLIPLNHSLESRPIMPSTSSENQAHLAAVPGVPQVVHPLSWNGTSNSRVGGYSSSPVMSSEISATPREDGNARGMQRNNISERPIFFPGDELRNAPQGPTNWSMANANVGIQGNIASTSRVGPNSGVHPSVSPTWLPHQSPPSQYPQTLSDFVRQAFPTTNPDTASQINNFLPQHTVQSSSSQELAPQPGSGLRTHQQQFLRSAFLMDRRNDASGSSLRLRTLAAAREGRSRIISEHIRNALDLMLRGENIRFEDVLILDQSVFYGVADLHDRHRDMRLDVDNMSYEELLALEERIGNVSTGLSEETILKHLKQRKYLSITVTPSSEAEPCCICQEDYLGGEDLGTLDCGHDFHTACIKQWLMHKNLCPICKTTAMVT